MVIAYLYSDLLNLYGNDGNIKILCNKLKELGQEVEIVTPTVNDKMVFENYDFIYMGSGTEKSIEIALNDIKRYRDDINEAVKANKMFLITGNSIDIFGKRIKGSITQDGLGIFNYESIETERIKKDSIYEATFLKEPILGFENHNYKIVNNENLLWNKEGVHYKKFYGTYLEGPILVRNPHFLKHILFELTNNNKVNSLDFELEMKAYNNFKEILSV